MCLWEALGLKVTCSVSITFRPLLIYCLLWAVSNIPSSISRLWLAHSRLVPLGHHKKQGRAQLLKNAKASLVIGCTQGGLLYSAHSVTIPASERPLRHYLFLSTDFYLRLPTGFPSAVSALRKLLSHRHSAESSDGALVWSSWVGAMSCNVGTLGSHMAVEHLQLWGWLLIFSPRSTSMKTI